MKLFWVVVAEVIPGAVLIGAVYYEKWRRRQAGERPPQESKLLREPGHTLRLQLEDMQDRLSVWLLLAMLGGGAFGITLAVEAIDDVGGCTAGALAAAAGAVLCWRTLVKMRPLRLGLMGEQAVAEQLQELVAAGYRVFHDVPGGGQWNIDHVAVGPAGVFAIETKARSKKPGMRGEKAHEVVFDGKRLVFPWGSDAGPVDQVQRNADWLSKEMTKATGDKVSVQPLLVLPGWFVRMEVNADLKELNAKQVPGYVLKVLRVMEADAIQRVAYQLDQRCRDVEF